MPGALQAARPSGRPSPTGWPAVGRPSEARGARVGPLGALLGHPKVVGSGETVSSWLRPLGSGRVV